MRAKQFAEDLGAIQTVYDAQLAPSDIESLELVEEVLEASNNKSNRNTKDKGGYRRNYKEVKDKKEVEKMPTVTDVESHNKNDTLDLEGYETTTRLIK
jgi:hypothetical protein